MRTSIEILYKKAKIYNEESRKLAFKETFNTKAVVKKLESYMDKVTEKECSPSTVQAAVNCADKICDFLKLHLEVERLKARK